jgi:hypothetical protein
MAVTAHTCRALALGLLLAAAAPARAAENYVIPSSEGYGIGECMHGGSACGRVIADSWCESHGHAHVLAFGTVEDVTGTVQASAKPEALKGDPGDIVIRCGD